MKHGEEIYKREGDDVLKTKKRLTSFKVFHFSVNSEVFDQEVLTLDYVEL